ncbi:MAG: vanadium-dependent haloperoxidase [Bacteroidota bacterium]
MRIFVVLILVGIGLAGCSSNPKKLNDFEAGAISDVVTRMTDLMVHDITNPPLAARFYSYACLAGYEIVSQNNASFKSMYGVLNEYPQIPRPDSITGYDYQLAAILSMNMTARSMQPSGKNLKKYEDDYTDSLAREGYDENTILQSKKYAEYVCKNILAYAKKDKYNKISNLQRYSPLNVEGGWFPTPPAFIAAVEPEFRTVRPFTLDTCAQFQPVAPVKFSKEKSSPFFKLMLSNYELKLSPEQKAVAAFWDCNPFAVQDNGHLLTSLKKISPGAHWLGITGIACMQGKKSFDASMQIFTLVSVGLMDGFISCWDEKYRSNRIRPETAIRKYIDPSWTPLLQTPPFPEYLSGHSVISSTSATILTQYFGENFHYTDSVEVSYGLPSRSFKSFNEAAIEAGISRYYGGIHFMDAIDEGRKQGIKVGEWVMQSFNANQPATASKK